jgi:adenylosuccinate synthase
VLDTFAKAAHCTGYRVGKDVYTEFPGDLALLEGAEPQYEWMDGWQTSTADARSLDQLPDAARRYLDRIQEMVETPITYVSVGTRRDQIIGV